MRRLVALLGVVMAVASAAPFVAVPSTPTRAQGSSTFLIPANDGYGIADCITGGLSCGQVVADAWCSAHGFGKATEYGRVRPEDITASIGRRASETPISVSCAD